MTGSNRRPSACKADALPAELITQSTPGAPFQLAQDWSSCLSTTRRIISSQTIGTQPPLDIFFIFHLN